MKTGPSADQVARPSAASGGVPGGPFEFDGEMYRQASTHQKEWGARLISELKLGGSERILDLGCGDGALTTQLASQVVEGFVLGIDSSPSMISAASHWVRPNLRFELYDINQIDYDDEFDVLFSNSALHWIKDHAGLFPRLLKALRADGVMRFNFPAAGNCATFNEVVTQVMALSRYAGGFVEFKWPWYMPSPEDYHLLIGRFPWRELQVYGENADRFFPDVETMIRWIDQPCLVPFLPRVAPADRESFRSEVIERMIRATRQPDGRCFETFRRIHLSARKQDRR